MILFCYLLNVHYCNEFPTLLYFVSFFCFVLNGNNNKLELSVSHNVSFLSTNLPVGGNDHKRHPIKKDIGISSHNQQQLDL